MAANDVSSARMDVRILGPLGVSAGGRPLPLRGAKPRALFALLLLQANEVVLPDRLIDELWGERLPATAANTLQVYVSQLRKLLPPGRLVREPPGYALHVEPGELDAARFERLAEEGRVALASGRHAGAAGKLRQALALWRGPALADVRYESFAQAEIARLEELRLAALEDRIEAELALGRHEQLAPEVEALVAEHPLRERLRGQLMLALYRSGRQADALEAYRLARRKLVEELGLEPGATLRALERAILEHDSSLELPVLATTPAPADVARRAVRKTVTVLAVDLVAGAVDPEVANRIAGDAFKVIDSALARHHGVVFSRSGARTTAVFGAPTAHEDDALRAARAALGAGASLAASETGARLELRAGIETGKVLAAGDGAQGAIAGEVIDAAARLAHSARPGEVLVGAGAEKLLRAAARLEPAGDKRDEAWRVLEVTSKPAIPRHFDVPLVGREQELAALVDAFEGTVRDRAPRLFSVLGAAGIGKSRLAAELHSSVGDRAVVVTGRCLPYGDGITFWPLAEIVQQLLENGGTRTLADLLRGEEDAELVAERVAGAVGAGEARGGSEETFWAVRRLLESAAREKPLVVVFDDCHWGEAMFLDLVEHVAGLAAGVPLLVVCLARPELAEDRPSWAGDEDGARMLVLEPLSAAESEALMRNLVGDEPLEEETRRRITEAAEGNPLFIEQMLAMLTEEEIDGLAGVPATIQALLAARLDRLPASERSVLEAASVVGKEFWRDAVAELSPEATSEALLADLNSLAHKRLIVPTESIFPGDDAFRFRHLLIRDAAYDELPKESRSELHERFADWLERVAPERVREFEEILGYHLEQAHRYRVELALPRDEKPELPARAAAKLASAGRRAYARGDTPGAVNLLGRATALLPDDLPVRLELLADLGEVVREVGDFQWAESILSEAVERSSRSGAQSVEWTARLAQMRLRSSMDPAVTSEDQVHVAEQAIRILEPLRDEAGLARAWAALSRAAWHRCRAVEAEQAVVRALEYAERAGDDATFARGVHLFLGAAVFGPTPVPEAIPRCEEVLARPREQRRIKASAFRALALLKAMQGGFGEARELLARDRALLEDVGLRVLAATAVEAYGLVELLAGEPAEAEREFRTGLDALEEIGDLRGSDTIGALLARAAYANGRYAEALRASELSEERAPPDDVSAQVQWRGPRAKVFARRGRTKKAELLAREGVALAEQTDFPDMHAEALLDLAEVLRLARRPQEAAPLVREAERIYRRKGNIVSSRRAQTLLRTLGELPTRRAAASGGRR